MSRPLGQFQLDVARLTRDLVVTMASTLVVVAILDATLYVSQGIATDELAAVFDATSEGGLASFLAVTQLAFVAATLGLIAAATGRAGGSRAERWGWKGLAAFFLYLAVDDGVRLHEGVGTAFAASPLSDTGLGAVFPSYYWQLLFGPVFAAVGVAMLVFLWRTLRTHGQRSAIVLAFAMLAVAVMLDFVDGLGRGHPLDLTGALAATDLARAGALGTGWLARDLVTHFSRVLEESLEILAFTVMWAVFLRHLGTTLGGLVVRFGPRGAAPASARPDAPAWVARPHETARPAPRPQRRPAETA